MAATNHAEQYKKFAFISYSHRDMALAKWLHKRLESFRLPSEIHNDIDAREKHLRPVFRDQEDLDTGVLSDELRNHLMQSKFLILICSKNSAKSEWVSNEAKTFVEAGRLDRIIPVIIPDGSTPERELFPAYLREYFEQNPDKELLGVNIGEVGKEKAFIRVVARMLGVSFDSLWKRHQRQKRARIAAFSAAAVIVAALLYLFAVPITLDVKVNTPKAQLPEPEKITLTVGGAEYETTVNSPEDVIVSLPGYKRFSKVSVSVSATYYAPKTEEISVGFGTSRSLVVPLERDETFAIFAGTVYDSEMDPLEGATVQVADAQPVQTDADGRFEIRLPLSEQRVEQPITISKPGYQTQKRSDEAPGSDLRFLLHSL